MVYVPLTVFVVLFKGGYLIRRTPISTEYHFGQLRRTTLALKLFRGDQLSASSIGISPSNHRSWGFAVLYSCGFHALHVLQPACHGRIWLAVSGSMPSTYRPKGRFHTTRLTSNYCRRKLTRWIVHHQHAITPVEAPTPCTLLISGSISLSGVL